LNNVANLYLYDQSQIEDGEIYATINQKDGMVRFHDNPEKYNSGRMLLQLDQEVRVVLLAFVRLWFLYPHALLVSHCLGSPWFVLEYFLCN